MRRRAAALAALALLAAPGARAQAPKPPPKPLPMVTPGNTEGKDASYTLLPGKTPGGTPNDYRVQLRIGDGGTLLYTPGTYTQAVHIGADFGFTQATLRAATPAWPPNVVLDGSTRDMAWGKALFHVSGGRANTAAGFTTTGTVDGVLFRNAGNKQAGSSGTAGAYADKGATLHVRNSAFENNTNGISAQEGAELVDVRDSTFSLVEGNGATDGKSHDAYVSARRNIFTRIIVGGHSTGNDIKIRAPYGRIDQSFLVAANGRWLDAPWGGDMAVTNSVLVTMPGAESDNMFAYAEEGSNHIDPAIPASGRITYANDLIVITRPGTAIMINDGEMNFVNCRFLFVQTESAPPTLKVLGTKGKVGKVTGLPYPLDAQGHMMIPASAIIRDRAAVPPTPRNPHDLPDVLRKLLPGPVIQMP